MATTPANESAPDYVKHEKDEHSHKHTHGEHDNHMHRHHHQGGDKQHSHGPEDSINQSNREHDQHHRR